MSRTHSRLDGLDALRGMAIGFVLLRHAWPGVFGGAGIVGVVAFFALSGYLITGLLVNDVERRGRVNYRRFYRNRALRLIPPLLVLLAGFTAVTLIWDPIGGDRHNIPATIFGAATYTMDIPGLPHGSIATSHLWTLAIEEQFYIVWPVLLLLAIRWNRMRTMLALAGVGLWLLCAASIVAVPDVEKVYTLPTSWAAVMVIGAAAQVYEHRVSAVLASHRRRVLAAAVGFAALAAIAVMPDAKDSPITYLVLGPVIGVATVAMIFLAREYPVLTSPPARVMVFLGLISYAAYLWNYVLVRWFSPTSDATGAVPLIVLVLTIAIASANRYGLEVWVQRWKQRLDAGRAVAPATTPIVADDRVTDPA